jgi:hypothetical protein
MKTAILVTLILLYKHAGAEFVAQPAIMQQDKCACLITRTCSTQSWCYINYIKTKLRNGLQLTMAQRLALWRWERCQGGCVDDAVRPGSGEITPLTNVNAPVHPNMFQRRRMRKAVSQAIRFGQVPLTNSEGSAIHRVEYVPVKIVGQSIDDESDVAKTPVPSEASVTIESSSVTDPTDIPEPSVAIKSDRSTTS